MSSSSTRLRGRQRMVNQVRRKLVATATAAAAGSAAGSDSGSDSDDDDLQYVSPIDAGEAKLYSYFGQCQP